MALTLPEHETHNHCLYGLTCEQYEALLAACNRRCQTCAKPSSETTARKLFIDHDNRVGKWAVRGLLDGRCNAILRSDRPAPEWARQYLADPWWRCMLAERGLSAEMPEPPEDRVLDFFDRIWFHRAAGWSTGVWRRPVLSWPELVRRYGPHNLRPYQGGPHRTTPLRVRIGAS